MVMYFFVFFPSLCKYIHIFNSVACCPTTALFKLYLLVSTSTPTLCLFYRYALVEYHSLQEAETMLAESKELKLKDNVLTCDLISHTSKDDGKSRLFLFFGHLIDE